MIRNRREYFQTPPCREHFACLLLHLQTIRKSYGVSYMCMTMLPHASPKDTSDGVKPRQRLLMHAAGLAS